jgi:hypothetical protein
MNTGRQSKLFSIFNCTFELPDDFRMKDLLGMIRDDHPDVVFKIYPVTAFASHEIKTGIE